MPSIRDIVHASGEVINAVPRDQVDAVLRTQLRQFIPAPFRIEGGVVTDGNGTKTEAFSALICVGGQLLDADGSKAIVPIDYVAAVIDATHTLDLNSLASAYSRVSAAKALKKTIPAPGNQTIEPTLGMIFSVNATASLEELADELVRLNARTPSEHWPDALVVANKGQICYMVQWVGDKEVSGLLLPPSPDAAKKIVFAYYAVLMISASGAGTFNLAMHMLFGHVTRWSPGNIPADFTTILDDVPREALTWTGYQYNLAGELIPVPRESYNDRALPPKSVALVPHENKDPLAAMCFIPWQDGGVILLRGKLPLEGMLVFLGGIIDEKDIRSIQKVAREDGLQISSVLPIKERQYAMMLRNIQQRGGLDVKHNQNQFVIQKFADEGSSSPFMARIFYGQMKMSDALSAAKREPFLKAHQDLMATLMEIREASKDLVKTWKDHNRKIDEGSIVERQGTNIRITENVDRNLGRLVNEFLTSATRSFKERMQKQARTLGLEIGFLYQKQSKFDLGLAALENTDRALANYLREARIWGNNLVDIRNNLDHGDWALPRATVTEVNGRVVINQPMIEGEPVTKWVTNMTDRVLSFVEDVIAHGIQKHLGNFMTLTEIPIGNRAHEMPVRFKNTIVGNGPPPWQIQYHAKRFDEI